MQVAGYMQSVMRTLAQCHTAGILHRDIKPSNFLLLDDGPDSPAKAIGVCSAQKLPVHPTLHDCAKVMIHMQQSHHGNVAFPLCEAFEDAMHPYLLMRPHVQVDTETTLKPAAARQVALMLGHGNARSQHVPTFIANTAAALVQTLAWQCSSSQRTCH